MSVTVKSIISTYNVKATVVSMDEYSTVSVDNEFALQGLETKSQREIKKIIMTECENNGINVLNIVNVQVEAVRHVIKYRFDCDVLQLCAVAIASGIGVTEIE